VGPAGNAFYTPPSPIPGAKNGDLIWATPLASPPAGSSGWQVLYRSENLQGQPIAVSGVIIAPTRAKPGSPVLTWAHGTTGLGDQCTPSKQYVAGTSGEALLAGQALAQGWTFLETDYEGLGTPGVHPYLVGLSESRGVLDIVRAAQQLPESGATAASPVMILGHSQGGGAALFAAEQAATYAPDLDVIGTAAGAPAGDLDAIAAGSWNSSTASAFGAEMIAGFHAAYPDLPLNAVVNTAGQHDIERVGTECLGETEATPMNAATVGAQNPLDNAQWATAVHDNTAGDVKPSAPMLIFHGEADTTVPRALTDLTLAAYCKIGATVQVKSYPGATHVSVILAALPDVQAFFAARLAAQSPTSSC
jgi:alpha-beta hydrolase superfamily lysophospholipase